MEKELETGDKWPLDVTTSRSTQTASFFANFLLAISLFATVVAIYFFTVATSLEAVAVKANTDRVVEEMLAPVVSIAPESLRKDISAALDGLEPPNMDAANEEVASSNAAIVQNVAVVIGIVLAASLGVVLSLWAFMWRRHLADPKAPEPFNIRDLFVTNGIILGFVALTELLFLGCIGVWYRSVDVNKVRKATADSFIAFIDSS